MRNHVQADIDSSVKRKSASDIPQLPSINHFQFSASIEHTQKG